MTVLTGTQIPADLAGPTWRSAGNGSWCIDVGYIRSPWTNRSCGISFLGNGKRIKRKHVKQVILPENNIQGRLAAVRTKSGLFDFTHVGLYSPPAGQSYGGRAKTWNKIIDALGTS